MLEGLQSDSQGGARKLFSIITVVFGSTYLVVVLFLRSGGGKTFVVLFLSLIHI